LVRKESLSSMYTGVKRKRRAVGAREAYVAGENKGRGP